MYKVDYQKLSEQYAGFLVAVGGVSITVLTLVLSLGTETVAPEVNLRSFLVAALLVATVTCFVGAHMMAETAAFIECDKAEHPTSPSGQRLFVLASLNIFIASILVLFALMLLPTSSGKVHAASLAPISGGICLLVTFGLVGWMVLAAYHRMSVLGRDLAVWVPLGGVSALGVILYFLPVSKECLLLMAFAPSALSTVISFGWFAVIFKKSERVRLDQARIQDIWFFSFAVTCSYAPLVVAGLKIVVGEQLRT
jgi:hypothetical protein